MLILLPLLQGFSWKSQSSRFKVRADFLRTYPVQEVGSRAHREYWIPGEELPQFNAALVGIIETVAGFHPAQEENA